MELVPLTAESDELTSDYALGEPSQASTWNGRTVEKADSCQPNDVSQIKPFKYEDLQKSDEVFKERFRQALKDGFFYVEMPPGCSSLIKKTLEYISSCMKDSEVKNTKFEGVTGYQDRGTQNETVYWERKYWSEWLPADVHNLAKTMDELALLILRQALSVAEIPCELWGEVTGGLMKGEGQHHLSLIHYRPEMDGIEGIPPHRDFGWVTVLYSTKEGLEAQINGEWVSIPPKEGYFIVNFGRSFETLVNNRDVICASVHRVVSQTEDRFSIGLFTDNNTDSPIYQQMSNGELKKLYNTTREYFQALFKEVYDKETRNI